MVKPKKKKVNSRLETVKESIVRVSRLGERINELEHRLISVNELLAKTLFLLREEGIVWVTVEGTYLGDGAPDADVGWTQGVRVFPGKSERIYFNPFSSAFQLRKVSLTGPGIITSVYAGARMLTEMPFSGKSIMCVNRKIEIGNRIAVDVSPLSSGPLSV